MSVPSTGTISLIQVCNVFQAPTNTPLSYFLRGGAYVANISANSAVPTALPVNMLSLRGAQRVASDPQISVTMQAEGDPLAPSVGRWYRDYNGLSSGLGNAAIAFADDYSIPYSEFWFGTITVIRTDTGELLHEKSL